MPSIATQKQRFQEAIDSGTIVPAPADVPKPPIPVADYPPTPNSYSRGPLPAASIQQPDMQRIWQTGATPQVRLIPLAPISNPVVGASAQSQAIQVVQNTTTTTTSSSTADVDLIPVKKLVFGNFDTVFTSTGNGASASVTGAPTAQPEVGIVFALEDNPSLGASPGAAWTEAIAGDAVWWQRLTSTASITATQSLTSGPYAQALMFFANPTTPPVFSNLASGSASNPGQNINLVVANSVTPTAGHAILVILKLYSNGGFFSTPGVYTISDTAGNSWVNLTSVASALGGGNGSQLIIFFCSSAAGVLTTISVKQLDSIAAHNIHVDPVVLDISNLTAPAANYTFVSSDLGKLIQFEGLVSVLATLPSTPFQAGWWAIVSNNTTSTVTLASSLLINGVAGNNLVIPPGGSMFVVCDGTNYETDFTALPQNTPAISNNWINSYNSQTGVFAQSQPAFSNISGNIAVAQVNSGTGASSSTFFRGDNTWSAISASTLTGYAATSQKSETAADTNVLTFTPPASAGSYRLRFVMSVSAANAATLGWTATWKDSNGNAQAPTNLALFQTGVAAPALTFTTSAAGNYHGYADIDIDNSATNIVTKLTFAGTSFAAKVSATIERLI
jgi:hypothetical protein